MGIQCFLNIGDIYHIYFRDTCNGCFSIQLKQLKGNGIPGPPPLSRASIATDTAMQISYADEVKDGIRTTTLFLLGRTELIVCVIT